LLTCKQFLDELSDYLDESLSAEERERLQKHIEECPNCWVLADTTKKTIQVYKCSQPVPLPPDIEERFMRALQKKIADKGCKGH